MHNRALFITGLAMGTANAVRHRMQGYVSPRPFDPSEVERTIKYGYVVVDRLQKSAGIDWTGSRVLEIGPGNDLTTGAVILHRGAASYHAVDLFDNRSQAAEHLYERQGEALGEPVDEAALEFTQTSFPDLPDLDGEYDLVISNATLEHVEDIRGLFRRLRELIASGGRMVHHIDGKTHMRWLKDLDPLNILRYPDPIYETLLSFPGVPNRLRAGDFERFARETGWIHVQIVAGRVASSDYIQQLRPAKRYRRRDDLPLLTFTLVADAE